MTAGIGERMQKDNGFRRFVAMSLERYLKCDWGDTCEEDKAANDNALKNDERIIAVYKRPGTREKIRIITECDRSYTTILFPSEY